ncbi:hypothetical protein [Flavobacterium fluviatile]|uniref:hypothetical protein n=1 Tax=Flavobacterium fluviatile TaxID=1862387 RepID=UPI0013D4F45E|nr:hypothetical protein [Flavobacterium fluviatile]
MKKICLLFFVFFLNSYIQAQATYDIVIAYERQPSPEKAQEYSNTYPSVSAENLCWALNGNSNRLIKMKSSDNNYDSHIDDNLGYYIRKTYGSNLTYINFLNVPAEREFIDYFIDVSFVFYNGKNLYHVDSGEYNIEFNNLLMAGNVNEFDKIHTYMGNFYVKSFKPNVSIAFPPNRNPATGTKTICANEQFGVYAYPEEFPAEIYNWQYSLDNKITWRDVPSEFHKANPGFTINDLLGNNHLNYLGKTIYFRMGYDSMVFAGGTVFPLIYSACGPTVSEVSFEGPGCNGDIVKSLSVTFNEKLNSVIGEQLASISVVDINNDSKIFMQVDGPVSYPDDSKKYTYTNFQQLETGHTYRIKYQAQIPNPNAASNPIMRGVLYSPPEFNFTYTEPKPLTFKVKADNPICYNDKVDITIEASGGIPPYYYDHLNGETEIIDGVSQVKRIRFDSSDINRTTVELKDLELKKYNIKVTDTNKCIEQ